MKTGWPEHTRWPAEIACIHVLTTLGASIVALWTALSTPMQRYASARNARSGFGRTTETGWTKHRRPATIVHCTVSSATMSSLHDFPCPHWPTGPPTGLAVPGPVPLTARSCHPSQQPSLLNPGQCRSPHARFPHSDGQRPVVHEVRRSGTLGSTG
ncbi:hypothetical protein PYCCODRAFT_1120156 [Trametes coccinea BRFM310]|uniref:Uncharacterized protein n=1 Tax=Trametes coccinea (strain BRFM310) TaxID=1353009 RepID=A0A1Y2IAV0_TRAC3|nr:hypothetical protein PYCCODRAFT_1120156 [Trametes coccinea BRFM310]